jgi:hypothetical protein
MRLLTSINRYETKAPSQHMLILQLIHLVVGLDELFIIRKQSLGIIFFPNFQKLGEGTVTQNPSLYAEVSNCTLGKRND